MKPHEVCVGTSASAVRFAMERVRVVTPCKVYVGEGAQP